MRGGRCGQMGNNRRSKTRCNVPEIERKCCARVGSVERDCKYLRAVPEPTRTSRLLERSSAAVWGGGTGGAGQGAGEGVRLTRGDAGGGQRIGRSDGLYGNERTVRSATLRSKASARPKMGGGRWCGGGGTAANGAAQRQAADRSRLTPNRARALCWLQYGQGGLGVDDGGPEIATRGMHGCCSALVQRRTTRALRWRHGGMAVWRHGGTAARQHRAVTTCRGLGGRDGQTAQAPLRAGVKAAATATATATATLWLLPPPYGAGGLPRAPVHAGWA